MNTRNSAASLVRFCLATLVCGGLAARLGAQSLVNVEFGAGGHSLKTGFAATGQSTNDVWNLFRLYDPKYTPGMPLVFSGRMAGIRLADGSPTDIQIDLTNAPGVWGNASGDPMYDSYVFAPNGSNIVVTISRLEAGRYNIYLYGHADPDASGEQNSVFRISTGRTNYGPLTTMSSAGWKAAMPWQEGQQFVVFRDVEVRSGAPMVIEVAPGPNGVAVLNGLQISSKGTSPPKLTALAAVKPSSTLTNLVIREIRYDGQVSDNEARFTADLEAESFATNEVSVPLFKGDVAVIAQSPPAGTRITRSGDEYSLWAGASGVYHLKLEVIAKITRAEPWNQIDFLGPPSAIASIRAKAAGEGVEMQLLGGTALEGDKATSQVEGFLGAGRQVSLRWQSKAAEVTRNALIAVETSATAQVTPAVIKLSTTLHYEMLQAAVPRLRVALPAGQALTGKQGEQIRDWKIETDGARQVLDIEFIKPVEKNYDLTIFTEQPVETLPSSVQITVPQPLDVERESGSLTLSAADAVVDIGEVSGLRRVNASGDALAAFRFSARPFSLTAGVKSVEPVLTLADHVTAHLEESRLLVVHEVALKVEKAGIYSVEFTPQTNFVVVAVKGDGVEDWKAADGKLRVSFASRALDGRNLEVQLEQALKTFPDQITIAPLRAAGATHQTAQVGAAAAPGLRVKTSEMTGLREIPVAQLPGRTDELLAFTAAAPDWNLTLSTERLPARIGADIFNLITIGDGVVGGSATVRYDLVNQGVQEFHLKVPAHWKNVEFTGVNIRSREQNGDAWTIHLQEKAWDGYTLVVTYDYQFDATNATLNAAGLHAPEAEHETGSLAVTTAASLEVRAGAAAEPLRVVDPTELAESDRALITRPVKLAYHYTGHDYALKLTAIRQKEVPVLDAVADHTQLTSVLTAGGEMLTQASFMVKNNGKQFQRFLLPPDAKFWGCYVDGQSSKAETDKEWYLVPLPEHANRDQAFAVDIVYAQESGPVQSNWIPKNVALQAPKTDLPNTFAEWELYVPPAVHLSGFGGSMTVARGTTYGLRDALRGFTAFYSTLFAEHGMAALLTCAIIIVMAGVLALLRAGWGARLIQWLAVLAIIALLGSMMLPALSTAKQKAQRASTLNNLKQIGVAARVWSDDNSDRLPDNLDQLLPDLGGSDKLLIDPESGERYTYVGTGKSSDPNAIIAYSPWTDNGRAVLFGDGRVERMSSVQFADAEAREAIASQNRINFSLDAQQPANAPASIIGGRRGVAAGRGGGGGAGGAVTYGAAVAATSPAPPQNSAQAVVQAAVNMQQAGVVGSPLVANGMFSMAGGALSANPTAAGLRSIHIDIPREGNAVTFTKVLNTGGEPLGVEMSVMSARVFSALRSTLQVAAFVLGLLLVWWQWRHNRSSLVITLGAALALGAVGALLISVRALDIALVIAAPVLILAVLVAVLRKFWPRKPLAPAAAPAPAMPPPNLPPPVIVSIALLLLLAGSALAQSGAGGPGIQNYPVFTDSAPLPGAVAASRPMIAIPARARATITSATYTGDITEHVAQFEGTLLLTSATTNQTVPLFGDDVALEDFSVKSGEAKLLREAGRLALYLPNPGEASVALKFVVKLGGDVSKRQLSFAIPPALASQLGASIAEPDADVEFPTAVAFQRTTTNQQTRIEATIGSADRVEVRWTPRVKRAAEVAATIFVENNTLATLANGMMEERSILDYQISQGELRQARVQLPAGHRLMRVSGDFIRTWQLEEPGDKTNRDVLVVDLLKDAAPEYKLTVETEKSVDSFPATVALETPHPLGVKRETGLVAARGSEELSLTVDHAADLQRVDTGEFPHWDTAQNLFSAWRFLTPAFSLALKAETVQPQVEAVAHNNVRISTEQTALSAVVDYTIKKAGVFALQIALPAGYTLESVGGDNILQWQPRDAGAGQVLDVSFKDRVMGDYSLRLELTRPHEELPPGLAAPGVHPLNTQKLSGFVSVVPEAGVLAKTAGFDGLTEIPAANLGAAANSATGVLAYKFLSAAPGPLPDWKLNVTLEKIDSWVKVEAAQVVSVSDTLVNGSAVLRYDIQNAPVKEFRLKIPAAYTNIEFQCPNLRRRDQTNDEWRVELQTAVHGLFTLGVTWEKPVDLKTNDLDLPGIQALGVERESGFVVIHGKPALQITQKSASLELKKIDAAELPSWVGNPAGPALAWNYVRPGYQLSVHAERFADAAVLQALADQVSLTTVVADDGQVMTRMSLEVRNNGLQQLEIQLPSGSNKVWSAYVGGEAVRPALSQDGKLLLPLEDTATGDAPVSIELTYVGLEKFPRGSGEIALVSPTLGAPFTKARWDLYLPPDYDYKKFAGSMSHEAGAAPVVQTYSLSEYKVQEAQQTAKKQADTRAFINNAQNYVANGQVSAVNTFVNGGNFKSAAASDESTRQQLEILQRDVENIQAGNLSQQGRVFNNAVVNSGQLLNLSGALPAQVYSGLAQQPQQLRPSQGERNNNDEVARQQWNKLEQAQELAVARVQPLHVNLPIRGLHEAFTQALQTKAGEPLTIQFTAANTRNGGLGRRVAGWGLALLGLWALVSALLRCASRAPEAA